MKRVEVDSLIERVLTEELENLRIVWRFFCRSVHNPITNALPYNEIGARLSRGKVVKKYHNCFSIVNPQAPYGTWTYIFLGRDKESAVKDYALRVEYNCFDVEEIYLLNSKLQPILNIYCVGDRLLTGRIEKDD